jgi:hypothetical protein
LFNILVFAVILPVLYIRMYHEQVWFTVVAAEKEEAFEKLVINNLPLGTKAVDVRALVSAYGKVRVSFQHVSAVILIIDYNMTY